VNAWSSLNGYMRIGIVLATAFLLLICWMQYYFWDTFEEYSFGYIVPAFVFYIIYDRWPKIETCLMGESSQPGSSASNLLADLLALMVLMVGLLFVLSGVLRRISEGPTALGAVIASVGFSAYCNVI